MLYAYEYLKNKRIFTLLSNPYLAFVVISLVIFISGIMVKHSFATRSFYKYSTLISTVNPYAIPMWKNPRDYYYSMTYKTIYAKSKNNKLTNFI